MSLVGVQYEEYTILAEAKIWDANYRSGVFRGVVSENVYLVEMTGLSANQFKYAQKVLQVVNGRKMADGAMEYYNTITFQIRPQGTETDDLDKCEEATRMFYKRAFGYKLR